MEPIGWIIIVVVVLVLIALAVWFAGRRKKQTQEVRDRFGPEYDRQVQERGSERAARQHLHEVEERREQLTIRPLSDDSRARYLARWQAVQTEFVDRPGKAVDEAARLVDDVMDERGYPGGSEQERSELMAADHPRVVEQYRAANDARRRHHASDDEATTEELRRAMVHYRELVTLLVEDGQRGDGERDQSRPVAPPVQDVHAGRRDVRDAHQGQGSHPVQPTDGEEHGGDDHPRHRAGE
jgi:hypothetical protein